MHPNSSYSIVFNGHQTPPLLLLLASFDFALNTANEVRLHVRIQNYKPLIYRILPTHDPSALHCRWRPMSKMSQPFVFQDPRWGWIGVYFLWQISLSWTTKTRVTWVLQLVFPATHFKSQISGLLCYFRVFFPAIVTIVTCNTGACNL